MKDRVARTLASIALAVALVAAVLAAYAVVQGAQYLEDVESLGEAMDRAMRDESGRNTLPMVGPPPTLDPGD